MRNPTFREAIILERSGYAMVTPDHLYSSILSEGPSPATYFLVLSSLRREGRIRRVIQECIRALTIYPNDIPIRRLLAESYLEIGQISQAEMELSKVVDQIGKFIPLFRLQAEIYRRQGRNEEAVGVLKIYLAHRPEDQEARDLLEDLKSDRSIPSEEALPPQKTFQEGSPLSAMDESEGDEAFIDEGEPAPDLERLPEIATPTLAEIYLDQDQPQEALAIYEKVIAQNPGDERSRRRLEELKRIVREEIPVEKEEIDKTRQKKERMITLLESWLLNIREKSESAVS